MKIKKIQNWSVGLITKYVGAILLLLFFISEAIDKIIKKTAGDPVVFAKSIKAIIFIMLLAFLLKTNFKRVLFFIVIPTVIFFLGQLSLGNIPNSSLVLILIKYLFPIALFLFFASFISIKHNWKVFLKIFEWILVINSIIIVFAFLFQIQWLSTYRFSRFGYNGLIYTSAASTYIYIITLYYFFLKSFSQKPNLFELLKILIILVGALLIGTKALYLGCFFILGMFLWKVSKPRFRKYIAIIMICCLLLGGYYLFFISSFFGNITQNEGLLTSILSYRNVLFETKTYPFIMDNWSFGNYLFGGISDIKTRTQMSYVDLVYFWGILGSVYYLIIYIKSFFTVKLTKYDWAFFLFLALVTVIAGNFFVYASIPIYLIVLRERIQLTEITKYTTSLKSQE